MADIGEQLAAVERDGMLAGKDSKGIQAERRDALQQHVDNDPGPELPKAANLPRAKRMFAGGARTDDEWVEFFNRRTDVLHAILGDVYIVHEYDERKQRGAGRDGRRTMPNDANLDKLWDITTPRYSMHPFPVAVKELIGERSLRQFAAKVPMDHRELSRMMRGVAPPTPYWLEQIAKAGKVNPAFFMEYRHAYVAEVLDVVFTTRPNLGIGVFKKLANVVERTAANGR
jgi:hypothetical protein